MSIADVQTSYLNLAAYKFVALDRLPERRLEIQRACKAAGLKGTVLLSPEGINLFVAGEPQRTRAWLEQLRSDPLLTDLEVKESLSEEISFNRMLVRLKKEIIAFGIESIQPDKQTSPKLPAEELKRWLDEGKEITLLDVRNDYEVDVGTFDNALPIHVNHFRDFPDAVKQLPAELKERPIVMFCTGGIRCEKAGPLMEQEGFKQIFQLDGGILKYFEVCGGAHYHGDCFVFDKRVAVKPDLSEADTIQCFACQSVLTREDQSRPEYVFGKSCPHCYRSPEAQWDAIRRQREEQIRTVSQPLPGSLAADNLRPINVPLRFDRHSLLECLCGMFPQYDIGYWETHIREGRVTFKGEPTAASKTVRSGEQYHHIYPATIEPDVNADIRLIHEDEAIIVVNKPAPLPVHPCGRFERNTLTELLGKVYAPVKPRAIHRLDANTTGVLVLAKSRSWASKIQPQFERGTVNKVYHARVLGHPPQSQWTIDAPIGELENSAGFRVVSDSGLPAQTVIEVLSRNADGTSDLKVTPLTGRTNQIRVHLWHAGYPIQGDPVYRKDDVQGLSLGDTQVLPLDQPRMWLHAYEISFDHPISGKRVSFTAVPWALLPE